MSIQITSGKIEKELPKPVRFGGPVRRVTELEVTEGDDAKLAVEIATSGRVGTFQGVKIDFNHDDLPSDEWWARPWWDVWRDGEHHIGLIFPGEAAHDAELRKLGVTREAIYALPGDAVSISRVKQIQEVSFLHHPHDYSVRHAYIKLTRADGTEKDNIGPLAFYGRTRLIGHGSREAFDNAIARIEMLKPNGLQQSGFWAEPQQLNWKNGADVIASHYAGQAHDVLFDLLDALDVNDTKSYVRLRSLVNATMLAGFALAKHEMKQAKEWEASREANRKIATAKAREASGSEKKIEAAKACWRDNPALTTNAVAEILINECWPDTYTASMSRTIKRFAPPESPSHDPVIFEPWA